MSPEMLARRGHTRMIDLYSLGALLYEMLTGLPPHYSENRQMMYKAIVNSPVKYPSYISPHAKSLISGLLCKDPRIRLGYREGIMEVKRHAFCSNIKWNLLLRRQIPPPIKLNMRISHFDPEYTRMAARLSEAKDMADAFMLRSHSISDINDFFSGMRVSERERKRSPREEASDKGRGPISPNTQLYIKSKGESSEEEDPLSMSVLIEKKREDKGKGQGRGKIEVWPIEMQLLSLFPGFNFSRDNISYRSPISKVLVHKNTQSPRIRKSPRAQPQIKPPRSPTKKQAFIPSIHKLASATEIISIGRIDSPSPKTEKQAPTMKEELSAEAIHVFNNKNNLFHNKMGEMIRANRIMGESNEMDLDISCSSSSSDSNTPPTNILVELSEDHKHNKFFQQTLTASKQKNALKEDNLNLLQPPSGSNRSKSQIPERERDTSNIDNINNI